MHRKVIFPIQEEKTVKRFSNEISKFNDIYENL